MVFKGIPFSSRELEEGLNQGSFLQVDMTALKHDNIVATFQVRTEMPATIVMELCDQNLRVLMRMERCLEMDEVSYIADELTKGVSYLHEQGISHQYANLIY